MRYIVSQLFALDNQFKGKMMRTGLKVALASLFTATVIAGVAAVATINANIAKEVSAASSPVEFAFPVNDFTYEPPEFSYPTGWLAAAVEGVPVEAGVPVDVIYVPELDIVAHIDGKPSVADQQFLPPSPTDAYIMVKDKIFAVPSQMLLINLPDIVPDAIYDIVYAYDTPSRANGNEIEGLTGAALPKYAREEQFDAYLGKMSRPAPAALGTAKKFADAAALMRDEGYRLIVWDCYRPREASTYISNKFKQAYNASTELRDAVGDWDLSWYAADGASGHNFGTSIDVAVADKNGNILDLPSHFDAFDGSAHLVEYPMNSNAITEDAYVAGVRNTPTVMSLHRAFKQAGFAELASEWWHFDDKDSQINISLKIGLEGLDFEARL